MEQRRRISGLSLLSFFLFCALILSFLGSVEAYKNYTVGDSLGWYDKLQNPKVDYQKWVAGKNFSLGDFLIFHTDNNHSVVQTYNFTTYKRCDYANANDHDTILWSATHPSAVAPQRVAIAVPLTKEGRTYFFSGDYDGQQCKHGQRFKINVTHGEGLPESLKDQPAEAPPPMSPIVDDNNPVPDTVIPSNFSNPKEAGDLQATSGSVSLGMFLRTLQGKLNCFLVLVVLVCLLG
ncbi:PREDICTED: blue copper protein-like [Nelumbo nucifera]|uniref:Blue copper protein-like n=1 Tax=Nelumbo nucifera TaxID=4432 RepID=A0A1U8B7H1_NELNU|nr:PREDICTED: blue copper protein-like [Nelumbo nucifera]